VVADVIAQGLVLNPAESLFAFAFRSSRDEGRDDQKYDDDDDDDCDG
jgi:hypothetical protein